MPCHSAISQTILSVCHSDVVEDVLLELENAKTNIAIVLDDDDVFLGVFSKKILLKNLIPVSVAMADGVQIDFKMPAAPGIAKRLAKVMPLAVSELMERKPKSVLPDEPVWNSVSQLTAHGEPLCVIDKNDRFLGVITYESLLDDLKNMETTDS